MEDYAIVDWVDDYSAFINHLCTTFRPFNVEANTENELEKLWMKENHKIAKYIVSFSQFALKVQWGEAAL
jgi:Retrotransposon gag protein